MAIRNNVPYRPIEATGKSSENKKEEATRIAMETNKCIARKSQLLTVKPTNDWECCLLIHPTKEEYAPRWNPKAEDLMAIDWEVVEREV